jgi:hypothetical protein
VGHETKKSTAKKTIVDERRKTGEKCQREGRTLDVMDAQQPKQETSKVCHLLHAGSLLGLSLSPADRSNMFLQTWLHPEWAIR